MRVPTNLSRRISQRLICFALGVFVGYQVYASLWKGPTSGSINQQLTWPGTASLSRGRDENILRLDVSKGKEEARRMLLKLNSEQNIRNADKFELHITKNTVVILIQVHKRKDDLAVMIESMRRVRYINESLIVFSHDYYSQDIFQLIHSIDFCPILQLFYPFSIQFYANRFPGTNANDCSRDIGRDEALDIGCYNAKYPDRFGHYREDKFTQMKHHWVWKQHFVFDRVHILKDFPGTVLRLDNDYYLAEDVVHVIRVLGDIKPIVCPNCLMYILGEHERLIEESYGSEGEVGHAISAYWFTGIGRGMAFKFDFWSKLKSCAAAFCRFDDYNWDWALEHTTSSCFKGLNILKLSAGRVFHFGMCHGFHRNVEDCDKKQIVRELESVLLTYKSNLFPKKINVRHSKLRYRNHSDGFGGWSDPRDHELCMNFFNNGTEDEEILTKINKMAM